VVEQTRNFAARSNQVVAQWLDGAMPTVPRAKPKQRQHWQKQKRSWRKQNQRNQQGFTEFFWP
jgi:hypothetical protein